MKTATLTIKKKYFEEILLGRKVFEYREKKTYYDRIFSNQKIDFLKLHYFKKKYLIVEVRGVNIITNDLDSEILKTKEIYQIDLGEVVTYFEK